MAELGRDPTRTITLRNRYARAARVRFRTVRQIMREAIIDRDVLALQPSGPLAFADLPPIPPRFAFPTSEEKVAAFMKWLHEAEDAAILEVIEYDGREIVARREWQNMYVRAGYQAGAQQATTKLVAAGLEVPDQQIAAVLRAPRHADALGMLYTRNFEELKGITAAMDQQISRELAAGLVAGVGPREIARSISRVVDGVGIGRANVLARTEIVRAHAEATLNRFEDFGIDKVSAMVEFSTAGDDRVCPDCDALEGEEFTIDEARGIIPVHPSCRCAWLPVIPERLKQGGQSLFSIFERRRIVRANVSLVTVG